MKLLARGILRESVGHVELAIPPAGTATDGYSSAGAFTSDPVWTARAFGFSITLNWNSSPPTGNFTLQQSDNPSGCFPEDTLYRKQSGGTVVNFTNPNNWAWTTVVDSSGSAITVPATGTGGNFSLPGPKLVAPFMPQWVRLVWTPTGPGTLVIRSYVTVKGI